MNSDRITLIGKQLRAIHEKMNGCSRKEIFQALDDALEKATHMYENLSPKTEEAFVVFTLGWFMYAADIATTFHDTYRSHFAAINKLYLDVYKKRPPKNERQKMKRTELAQPEPIGAKVK